MVDLDDNTITEVERFRLPDSTVELDAARDKSITHRAYMFASIAAGVSTIRHPLASDDCLATLAICQKLGARVEQLPDGLKIHSSGWDSWNLGKHQFDFIGSDDLFCNETWF